MTRMFGSTLAENSMRETIEIGVQTRGANYITDLDRSILALETRVQVWNNELAAGTKTADEHAKSVRRLVENINVLKRTQEMAQQALNRGSIAFGTMQDRSASAARGVLEISRALEDFITAGPIGALNNIPTLFDNIARSIGLSRVAVAGLTAGVSVAATAAFALWRNWDSLINLFTNDPIARQIASMKELADATRRTADEQERLNAQEERNRNIDSVSSIESEGRKSQKSRFNEAISRAGGSKDFWSAVESQLLKDGVGREEETESRITAARELLDKGDFRGALQALGYASDAMPFASQRLAAEKLTKAESGYTERRKAKTSGVYIKDAGGMVPGIIPDLKARAGGGDDAAIAQLTRIVSRSGLGQEAAGDILMSTTGNVDQLKYASERGKAFIKACSKAQSDIADLPDDSVPAVQAATTEIVSPLDSEFSEIVRIIEGFPSSNGPGTILEECQSALDRVAEAIDDKIKSAQKKQNSRDERAKEESSRDRETTINAYASQFSRNMDDRLRGSTANAILAGQGQDQITRSNIAAVAAAMRSAGIPADMISEASTRAVGKRFDEDRAFFAGETGDVPAGAKAFLNEQAEKAEAKRAAEAKKAENEAAADERDRRRPLEAARRMQSTLPLQIQMANHVATAGPGVMDDPEFLESAGDWEAKRLLASGARGPRGNRLSPQQAQEIGDMNAQKAMEEFAKQYQQTNSVQRNHILTMQSLFERLTAEARQQATFIQKMQWKAHNANRSRTNQRRGY